MFWGFSGYLCFLFFPNITVSFFSKYHCSWFFEVTLFLGFYSKYHCFFLGGEVSSFFRFFKYPCFLVFLQVSLFLGFFSNITVFSGINVPRARFLPVKTTSDLLIIMSNLYSLRNGTLVMNPKRMFPSVPLIKLGTSFKKVCKPDTVT